MKRGLPHVSLRMVAAASGYSPASLYGYFGSWEDLLHNLSSRALGRLNIKLRAVKKTDPVSYLIDLGKAYIEFGLNYTQDFLLAFSRLSSGRKSFNQEVPEKSPYAVVLSAVSECVSSGIIRLRAGLTAETAAFGLWGLVHGITALRITHLRDFRADFDANTGDLIRAYIAGFK